MALVNFSNLDFDQVKQSLKDYLKSIKQAKRPVTTNAQKRLDKEEAIKKRNGHKRVKYMYDIQL